MLCEMNMGSRSQVKELIRKGTVKVNDQIILKPETRVDPQRDRIVCKGQVCRFKPFVYYMMYKPQGVVTATRDREHKTVMDIFREQYGRQHQGDLSGIPLGDLFPAGRLDKDTEGLLIITNDGAFAHELFSPAKHVPKKYYARLNGPLSRAQIQELETGLCIGNGTYTKPAAVEELGAGEYCLTITEGKFHQVKRMFQAVGLQVLYLKRLSVGTLSLDEKLRPGEIRELTENEVKELCWKG